MKYALILLAISLNAFGAPCGGAPGAFHTNPDGSTGGFVARTASVSKTVYLDSSSTVCEKAEIVGSVRIEKASFVAGSAKVQGGVSLSASRVKGQALIYGGAIVINSAVCQMSQINFKVIDSKYYCDIDDEEPQDPGELGNRTLLGMDSNVNGIRDDVEIWINNISTNTPNKNLENQRRALKQIAKKIQENILNKDNKEESIELGKATLDAFDCLQDVVSEADYELLSGDVQVRIFNTIPRLKAWAKLQGNLSGQEFSINAKKEKGKNCAFDIR